MIIPYYAKQEDGEKEDSEDSSEKTCDLSRSNGIRRGFGRRGRGAQTEKGRNVYEERALNPVNITTILNPFLRINEFLKILIENKSKPTSKLVVLLRLQRGQNLLTPGRVLRGLTSHHYYRQPLKAAVFFCLLSLAARKRVYTLFEV